MWVEKSNLQTEYALKKMDTFLYKVFIMAKHGWHRISRTQDASCTPPPSIKKKTTLIAHFSKKNDGHWIFTENKSAPKAL